MTGVPALRQAIAAKLNTLYGSAYDADRDITLTTGGTQGLITALHACVGAADVVIIIEPAYDSDDPAIRLAGAVPVEFAQWRTTEIGVAAIPLSGFYQQPQERGHVRFCFAKRDETLAEAARRLAKLRS